MKATFTIAVFGLGLAVSVMPGLAHHSVPAQYDVDRDISIRGVVTRIEWTNPHTWFYIDVRDQTGKVTNWGLEMGSPNGLMRAGWTRNSMKVGDVVTVESSRAKDGSNHANAKVVILKNSGKRLFAASSQGQQP